MKSNGPVSLECPSKADCLRLKVYYGAWIKKTGTSLWSNSVFPPRHQSFIYLAAMITALRHGALYKQEKMLATENIMTRKKKQNHING